MPKIFPLQIFLHVLLYNSKWQFKKKLRIESFFVDVPGHLCVLGLVLTCFFSLTFGCKQISTILSGCSGTEVKDLTGFLNYFFIKHFI